MKLAFSTLGCPRWGLAEIVDAACRLDYDGVELRCLAGEVNLLDRPELRPEAVASTRALFESRGLEVCCVDTSASFHAIHESERRENVDTAVRLCAVADALGAPLIRVFPNEVPREASRDETGARIAAALREVCERAPRGVRVGLETHGDFATAEAVAELVRRADHPSLAVVWDVANTMASGETIQESVLRLGPNLAHVHLRDARPVAGERFWRPVLAGRGHVSFDEVLGALRALDFGGYVAFEWEKHWRPELEEPEVAFADFRGAVRGLQCS